MIVLQLRLSVSQSVSQSVHRLAVAAIILSARRLLSLYTLSVVSRRHLLLLPYRSRCPVSSSVCSPVSICSFSFPSVLLWISRVGICPIYMQFSLTGPQPCPSYVPTALYLQPLLPVAAPCPVLLQPRQPIRLQLPHHLLSQPMLVRPFLLLSASLCYPVAAMPCYLLQPALLLSPVPTPSGRPLLLLHLCVSSVGRLRPPVTALSTTRPSAPPSTSPVQPDQVNYTAMLAIIEPEAACLRRPSAPTTDAAPSPPDLVSAAPACPPPALPSSSLSVCLSNRHLFYSFHSISGLIIDLVCCLVLLVIC